MDDAIAPAYAWDAALAAETLREAGVAADARFSSALAAAAGSAPYLRALIGRRGASAARIASEGPDGIAAEALARAQAAAGLPFEGAMEALREAKADLHLACAVGDLSGAWDLARVTGALSALAETACRSALALAAQTLVERGELTMPADSSGGPVPGFIVLAMGKLGARELNYSSDVDLTLFFDQALMPVREGGDARQAALRLVPPFVRALEEVTGAGYVFRTDLRLRPDPASTPVVVSVAAAEAYYQSVGQNWERAAMIKARPIAGDLIAGAEFLTSIAPFVWRRHLDYAAIADIHSIKRQIRSVHAGGDLDDPAPDVKLGHGGIRDIELFVQTQQLILGGRNPALRAQTTLGALDALRAAGMLDSAARDALAGAYVFHRKVEHRIQMLADEQTHRVPADAQQKGRLAALCGFADATAFDAALRARRAVVEDIDARLFRGSETLADPLGGLIFTGVEDDPTTLATLAQLGFKRPAAISAAVRGWHHGRMRATRSERAREILTALMPKLLRALAASGEPDAAFNRFDDFLHGVPAGVQLLALLQAQPALLTALTDALGLAPRLATVLAQRPALIDALLDPRFAQPIALDPPGARLEMLSRRISAMEFEPALNEARRFHREETLRIGLHVLQRRASAALAGAAHADLAEACVAVLSETALAETERRFGQQPGRFCIAALGKFGGAELAEGSDLDIMLIYDAPEAPGASLSAAEFYTRLTQRLISALSAPTEEGGLYEIDMALRPSGSKGPPAVRLSSFERYYREEAWTWELLALTRLRPVAGDTQLGRQIAELARARLAAPRDRAATLADVAHMRARMDRERPSNGLWDLKLAPGGLVDIEFIAQALILVTAHARPGVIHVNTGAALEALAEAGALTEEQSAALGAAWRLYSDLTQLLRICVGASVNLQNASERLRARLTDVGAAADFPALETKLAAVKTRTRHLLRYLLDVERNEEGARAP